MTNNRFAGAAGRWLLVAAVVWAPIVSGCSGDDSEDKPFAAVADANDAGGGFEVSIFGDTATVDASGGVDTGPGVVDAVTRAPDAGDDGGADGTPATDTSGGQADGDGDAGGAGDGSNSDLDSAGAGGDAATTDGSLLDGIAQDGAADDGGGGATDTSGGSADAETDGSDGAPDGGPGDGGADDGGTGDAEATDGSDGAGSDAGAACTKGPGCACDPTASSTTICDDDNPCTLDTCSNSGQKAGAGVCVSTPKAGPCDDGDACTTGDACDAKTGTCDGDAIDPKITCNDNKPCTKDSCDAKKGCQHIAQAGTCDDGDPCTTKDACNAVTGKCVGANQVCTSCKSDADCPKAKNPCNGTIVCDLKAATPTCKLLKGSAVQCSQVGVGQCTSNTCDPKTGKCTGVVNVSAGLGCDDNNPCTLDDACVGDTCTGFGSKICNDKNPCTSDSCDKSGGGCVYTPISATCDDGDPCTMGETCVKGACKAASGASCDDKNACTKDACVAGVGCKHTAITGSCDDGDACTSNDTCTNGVCAGAGVKCDDGNACTKDGCGQGGSGCTYTAVQGSCDDGDACTTGDFCNNKACTAGPKALCDDKNPCTTDSCDSKKGCAHVPVSGACDDGDSCSLGDSCDQGTCKPGSKKKSCDDNNPCTVDSCKAGVCVATANEGAACDDGDACTTGDFCKESSCIGKKKDCSSLDSTCAVGTCAAGTCKQVAKDGAACSDNNACTEKDVCSGGACKPGTPKVCPGGGDCVTVACNTTTGACGATYLKAGTKCTKGVCDGKGKCTGVCAPQSKIVVDGCSATSFDATCTAGCAACKPEGGFSASNGTGCGGKSCFARVSSAGVSGFVAMQTQPAETATAEWKFGKTLCGKYRIYVDIPNPGSAAAVLCGSWSYVFSVKYLLREGDVTLESKVVNQAGSLGKSVLLFERDMTGVTGVRVGNQAPPVGGCQQVLLDRLRAEPIP